MKKQNCSPISPCITAPAAPTVSSTASWPKPSTSSVSRKKPSVSPPATGCKRVNPNNVVFTYQGDGDLASIGAAEITHAATRGENITVIFVNNAIYGMTGGQMAPTTLPGQVTTTSPYGRDPKLCGYPIRVSEMLATLDGPAYIARVSVHDVKHIMDAKKCIKKAFETQIAGKGFSMVEVLSACPTNWGMTPQEALKWLEANMIPQYPLGVKKEVE